MITLDTLTQRNHDFVTHHFVTGLSMMPTLRTMIISCVDPRVDPAHVLGIELGEAVVIRNIGGRITPATLQTIGMLQALAQAQGGTAQGGFHLVILHHTDCGITRLEAKPDLLAAYMGVGKAELATKAISDPHAAVALDVAMLKATSLLPQTWALSGLVYDVTTGHVEVVVPPTSLT